MTHVNKRGAAGKPQKECMTKYVLAGKLHLMDNQPGVADAYVLQFSKMVRENPTIFPGGVDMYKPHLQRGVKSSQTGIKQAVSQKP